MPSFSGPLPKYYQLAQILRQQIQSGVYQVGDQLPSETRLSADYQLSRGTVRQALQSLAHEGLIRSAQGRGTYVIAPAPQNVSFQLARFDEEIQARHQTPTTQLITAEIIPAHKDLAHRLELQTGESVFHLVRLRLADNLPIVYETRYLAYNLCPNLLENNLEKESIHTLLVEKYNIPLVKTIHVIEARALPENEARALGVQCGTAAFFIDRLTYTEQAGRVIPAVWYQAYYRGDEYQFHVEIGHNV